MYDQTFGLKEIYSCILKSTYDIEIDGNLIVAGEPIVTFDKIQMASFQEVKKRVDARGGYGNPALVSWESTQEVAIPFTQGVLSRLHFALTGNSNIETQLNVEAPKEEYNVEVEEDLTIKLREVPSNNLYVYNRKDGKKVDFTQDGNLITFSDAEIEPYDSVDIYYDFITEKATIINIGRRLLNGYLTMQAKTRLKDDRTGKTVTGVIKIPKAKLVSDFSIRLGEDVPPNIGRFQISAFPVGSKGSQRVMDFIVLENDIDSDIN